MATERATVALVNAELVHPDRASSEHGGLLIKDGLIVAAGASVTDASVDVVTFDMDGRYIMPGLIDTHVHLTLDGGAQPMARLEADPVDRDAPERATLAADNARSTLDAGTTTVRDLGGSNDITFHLRSLLGASMAAGPRLLASGLVITTPGGHGHYFGRPAQTDDGVQAAVERQIADGADCIKVMATGGVHTLSSNPEAAQFGLSALRRAAETAHRSGRPITAHVINDLGASLASAAGFDSIQHGASLSAETAEALASAGTRLNPTLATRFAMLEHLDDDRVPSYVRDRSVQGHLRKLESFARAIDAGVTIVAGTDAGSTFVRHGSMARELAVLVDAGLPPFAALAAATSTAAIELGLADRIGRLEPGYDADLLVLAGDPVDDISVLAAPVSVYRRGISIARSATEAHQP